MFTRFFNVLNEITLLSQPKLYFLSELWICCCILLQRVILFAQHQNNDQGLKYLFQIIIVLLLFAFEYLLLWFFSRKKPPENIQIFCILLFHLLFSQAFIEVGLLAFHSDDRNSSEIIFQEIFFLTSALIFFTDSKVIKGCLLSYLAAISLLRLTSLDSGLQYISWGLMFAFLIVLPLLITIRQKKVEDSPKSNGIWNKIKLENALEGITLINKDKEVLYMNGLFKGLMEVDNEKEALLRMLKLRKVEHVSNTAQKSYLNEIKLKPISIGGSRREQRSYGEIFPKSTSDHPTSLEVPKSINNLRSRSMSPRPSIFHNRTSIFQHRPSILQPISSPASRKESKIDSLRSPELPPNSGLPMIKINLTRAQDEDSRPLWFGSDSFRSPLVRNVHESSFGGEELKSTIKSFTHALSINDHHLQSDNLINAGDTVEKNLLMSDFVETFVDTAFANMDLTTQKSHNLVISHLLENMESLDSPLEFLKGESTSPKHMRGGQDSTYLGIPARAKFNVIMRDTKNGTKILEVLLCPFVYQEKECLCICTKDISYEVKSEDLNESLEYVKKLLRFVSHESRGPLNCIISLLEPLKNFVSNEVSLKYISPSFNSAKMLLSLVNDILDHAQIQARKLKINIVPCKIKKVFEEVMEMIEIQAKAQHVPIKLKWDSRIPQRFYTDPNRLRQIILNLVSNSLKYSDHGSITIQAEYESPVICRVSVSDTGVGISKENLKLLFQEFGKVQANSHLNPNGIGLGLVISKLLTMELGIEEGLMVDSEEGKGSTFYFYLESKIEKFVEEVKLDEEGESLDENGDYPPTPIRTTYGIWNNNVSSRRASIKIRPPSGEANPRRDSRKKTLSPVPLSRQEIPAPKITFSASQSKTVENLESMSGNKKTSIDNILAGHKKNTFQLTREVSRREGRGTFLRSYTMEGGASSRRSNTVKSDSEFTGFLKKVKHTCGGPKALLVDDNKFNLTALEALLSNTFGIDSKPCMNGEEAIQEVINNEQCCVKCKNFKVIFMDIEMPRLNGFETTQILRKKMLEGEISFIPIIGITGHNPSENRVQCLTSGMNDLVSKPVSPKIMKELIIKWMATT